MDSVLKDSRFAKIATDKKFRPLEKKKRKVNIDNRFQSVLKVRYPIKSDKYGIL